VCVCFFARASSFVLDLVISCFLSYFLLVVVSLVVNAEAARYLERLISKVMCGMFRVATHPPGKVGEFESDWEIGKSWGKCVPVYDVLHVGHINKHNY